MRLGILGGAFNPPHIGHLVLAQEAWVRFELDRVLFVPVGRAPHKEIDQDPGAEARFEMCELAVAGDDYLEASRIELDRDGPSYTVDTLRELRERSPDDELVLLIGGDQVAALPSWREPEELLRLATVGAVERGGWHREGIAVKIASLKGSAAVCFFHMPRIEVSSSQVRSRVSKGLPIRYLVPEAIAGYIAERGLYAAADPVAAS